MSKICLVIMPFSPEYEDMQVLERAIKPACVLAGFDCVTARDPLTVGNIIERTIDLIFQADVIIADLSGSTPNVFYELGVAHAMEKLTVMICEEKIRLPFNVRTYRVIFYKPNTDGVERILRSTLASILNDLKSWASVPAINPVQAIRIMRQLEERRRQFEERRHELKTEEKQLEEERRRQPEVLEFILPDIELDHLRAFGAEEFLYKKQSPFLDELRHLRWAGLIRNRPGTTIGSIPDEGNLKDYLELTEKGKRFLAYLQGISPPERREPPQSSEDSDHEDDEDDENLSR